jgi:hypothetical protein
MSVELREPLRLKGLLRLLSSQCQEEVRAFEYDPMALTDSHAVLQNRRRRRPYSSTQLLLSQTSSFEELVNRHRYVCFFVIQGNASNFYSKHCLMLRKRLAEDYHDVMTTFLIAPGDRSATGGQESHDNLFCKGSGFATLPASAVLLSMININQVPAIVILDTSTGQRISRDAMLAMEWNDPHSVINAWQRGKSGLDCTQKILAVASFQSDCCIL